MKRSSIRFENQSHVFTLSAVDIDLASEWLTDNLEKAGAEKSDRLRMRLLFEEALLNMADFHGKEQEVAAYLERKRGRFRLRVVAKGKRFNPLRPDVEDEQSVWSTSLFSVIDLRVHYAYSVGTNVLRLSLPRPSMNPVLKIIIALAAGALIGILGNILIPDYIEKSISSAILTPIGDMWVRLLQAIAGPVIFLTALTAAFGTKRISDFGGSRFGMVARYFTISAIVVLFTLACCLPIFFPLDIAATEANGQVLSNTLDNILQIVPDNLVEPFSEANTPQLLLIAIATGYLLARMDSQVLELNVLIRQLDALGLAVAQSACSVVPFFVGLLLCLKMWTHDMGLLESVWVPLVISIAISVIVLVAVTVAAAVRNGVSPSIVLRKLRGPFVAALKKGTLDFSAIDDLADSCKRLLGINKEFARAVLPQGLFLYMPTSAVGICVFVLFAAREQQLAVDQMWIASLAVLSVVMAVATPPMTGANLLSFVATFSYLGISNDALLGVMVFDIVFGVLCIAFDQAMLQIETIHQADKMGFLDEEALRAPEPTAA